MRKDWKGFDINEFSKKTRDGLFGSGKFYKNALSIAVPIMLQQLIQSMVSLVDNFMVSGLGDVAMSGVNVAGQIIFVFMVYVNTICMAGGIFMTEFFRIDGKLFGTMLKKGALMLFCEMVWVLSETMTTAIYNGRGGADVVSGMASGFAIANLFFVAFSGIYSATGVIIGKTLGTGKLEEARTQKKWILSGAAVLGIIMTFVGFGTTLVVPVVFGRLSDSAVDICRSMVVLLSFFMPVWVIMNAQQAIARAGGDTAMGMYTDAFITILVMLPMLFVLARYTNVGPVTMYFVIKLLDLVKVVIFHIWLRKERWLKNLTVPQAA